MHLQGSSYQVPAIAMHAALDSWTLARPNSSNASAAVGAASRLVWAALQPARTRLLARLAVGRTAGALRGALGCRARRSRRRNAARGATRLLERERERPAVSGSRRPRLSLRVPLRVPLPLLQAPSRRRRTDADADEDEDPDARRRGRACYSLEPTRGREQTGVAAGRGRAEKVNARSSPSRDVLSFGALCCCSRSRSACSCCACACARQPRASYSLAPCSSTDCSLPRLIQVRYPLFPCPCFVYMSLTNRQLTEKNTVYKKYCTMYIVRKEYLATVAVVDLICTVYSTRFMCSLLINYVPKIYVFSEISLK